MTSQTLLELFKRLGEMDQIELLAEAKLSDDRPSYLRQGWGNTQEGLDWLIKHQTSIAPLILRWTDASDDEIAALAAAKLIQPGRTLTETTTFKVRFAQPDVQQNMPLSEIAADTVALTQLVIAIIAANRPFGAEMVMPQASVAEGSLGISLTGPGLFGFGTMLVAACATGVVTLPFAVPVVGGLLGGAGLIDLVLNWRKTAAEVRKLGTESQRLDEDRRKIGLERELLELQEEKTRLEIQKLRQELRADGGDQPRLAQPASSFIPLAKVRQAAAQSDLSIGYSLHILNRVLPTAVALQRVMPGRTMSVELGRSASRPAPRAA